MSTELIPLSIDHGGATWALWRQGAGEPLARDLDLAAWLEFERPRNVRKLIERHAASLGDLCSIVEQTGGRPAQTYYLTEEQALFLAAKSETPKATQVLKAMIAVFLRARDMMKGALAPAHDLQAMESMARLVLQMEERLRRVEDRGRPETPMQKRDAARLALEQWPHLSDRQLARRAGVGATLVGEVRTEIGATAKTRQGRDNKVRRVPQGTARREQLPAPAAAVLERFGLVVTRNMTTPKKEGKTPREVWNVTGTQREWAPILRDLGGRWYRPAQQWTFFRDPSEELAAAFLAAFPEEVQS